MVPGFSHRPPAPTSSDWVIARCFAVYHSPSEEEPPFPDGRFDALAFRLLEGLGVREAGGVVCTTLEAKDRPKDFEVRFSELVTVSRVEGTRHTPVQQGLNSHGHHQQSDLQLPG